MNADVSRALEQDRVIDITTTGRKTGQPRRIEIWFHNVEGRLFITGPPGRRDWFANLVAHSEFTFHLKRSVQADLPAKATPILDDSQRRELMAKFYSLSPGYRDLEVWVKESPLVEVELQVA